MSSTYGNCNTTSSDFLVWKTVVVGTLGSSTAAYRALRNAGIHVSDWASRTIGILPFSPVKNGRRELRVARVSGKELGFVKEGGVSTKDIYAAAERTGLSLCPPELAIQLWLQHPGLLRSGDWTLVAMRKFLFSVESGRYTHRLLFLAHDRNGTRRIGSNFDYTDGVRLWSPECTWLFIF